MTGTLAATNVVITHACNRIHVHTVCKVTLQRLQQFCIHCAGAPTPTHTLHSQSGGMRQMMLGEGRASRASVMTSDRQQQARAAKQQERQRQEQQRLQAALDRQLAGSSDDASADEGGWGAFAGPSLGPSGSGVHKRSISSMGLGAARPGNTGSRDGVVHRAQGTSASGVTSEPGAHGSSMLGSSARGSSGRGSGVAGSSSRGGSTSGIMSSLPQRSSGVGDGCGRLSSRRSAVMSPEAIHRASVIAYKAPQRGAGGKGRDSAVDWSSSDDSEPEALLSRTANKRLSAKREASSSTARACIKQGEDAHSVCGCTVQCVMFQMPCLLAVGAPKLDQPLNDCLQVGDVSGAYTITYTTRHRWSTQVPDCPQARHQEPLVPQQQRLQRLRRPSPQYPARSCLSPAQPR